MFVVHGTHSPRAMPNQIKYGIATGERHRNIPCRYGTSPKHYRHTRPVRFNQIIIFPFPDSAMVQCKCPEPRTTPAADLLRKRIPE